MLSGCRDSRRIPCEHLRRTSKCVWNSSHDPIKQQQSWSRGRRLCWRWPKASHSRKRHWLLGASPVKAWVVWSPVLTSMAWMPWKHGLVGVHTLIYGAAQRHLILQTARRSPDREQDGTATWSLTTLQRVLRQAPGLERISTFTILSTLHGAGMTWQRDRTWCETGTARRLRKAGVVVVTDPDTEAKKS